MTTGAARERSRVGVVVAAILIAGGCSARQEGPQRFAVSGQITFDGKPVPAGRITLEPDTAAGNSGPAGYGNIIAGRFTTYPRMGAVAGPHVVRISGFDGVPAGEMVEGKPLFAEYMTKVELPAKAATVDFEVPRIPVKPAKGAAPPGKPQP
ncbi:MAG: hypothetical protein EBR28_02800 [Planctomycetia bacterium]|nr:hypothetical protein [Planctomycetia bacterium]